MFFFMCASICVFLHSVYLSFRLHHYLFLSFFLSYQLSLYMCASLCEKPWRDKEALLRADLLFQVIFNYGCYTFARFEPLPHCTKFQRFDRTDYFHHKFGLQIWSVKLNFKVTWKIAVLSTYRFCLFSMERIIGDRYVIKKILIKGRITVQLTSRLTGLDSVALLRLKLTTDLFVWWNPYQSKKSQLSNYSDTLMNSVRFLSQKYLLCWIVNWPPE